MWVTNKGFWGTGGSKVAVLMTLSIGWLLLSPGTVRAQEQAHAEQGELQGGVPVEAATDEQKEEALKQYRLGVDLTGAGKLGEALEMFRSSYNKVNSPNSRLMVARTLAKLERYPEAYRELQEVIKNARELAKALPKYEKTVDAAQKELAGVQTKVALLRLDVDGQVTVDGEKLPPSQWGKVLARQPGEVKVVYELDNGQHLEKVADLKAGRTSELELKVPAPEPATEAAPVSSPSASGVSYDTLGWVGAGVGVVGLAAFATFGVLNNKQFGDLEEQCSNNRCPASLSDDAETGRTYQTLANVGLGVGLVGAATAAYFLVFADDGIDDEVMLEERAKTVRATEVRVGLGSVQVRGRF